MLSIKAMADPEALSRVYLSALKRDGSGYIRDVDRSIWAQAEVLRLSMGCPLPDAISRLRADTQCSAWYWHSVLPELIGRARFHCCLADIKERAFPAFESWLPSDRELLEAVRAERAYAAGEITGAARIEALDAALKASEYPRNAGQNGPMFAAQAAGYRTLRDVSDAAARAEGWRVGGVLPWGPERDAAIATAQAVERSAQVEVIARWLSAGG